MPTRLAEVIRVESGSVHLRLDAICADCGGCGGRCSLLMRADSSLITLSTDRSEGSVLPGQRVQLQLDDSALLRQAWRGYGLPLLGLMLGAAALQPLGNGAAAIGALCGTSLALALSRQPGHAPLRMRPVRNPPSAEQS